MKTLVGSIPGPKGPGWVNCWPLGPKKADSENLRATNRSGKIRSTIYQISSPTLHPSVTLQPQDASQSTHTLSRTPKSGQELAGSHCQTWLPWLAATYPSSPRGRRNAGRIGLPGMPGTQPVPDERIPWRVVVHRCADPRLHRWRRRL